jgi:signal transduction histidine kinase
MRDLIDWFVPPVARGDAHHNIRHRGIAKSLLTISGVVALMFVVVLVLRSQLSVAELAMFAAGILTPLAGALLIRLTGDITPGLLLANVGGILIIGFWAYISGGIASVALPGFLANTALLATFGNATIVLTIGALLGIALLLLYVASVQGWLPASVIATADQPEMMLIAMLGSAGIVVLAGIVVTRERAEVKATLRKALRDAEQSNRAKSAFLGAMSEEFRNPLTRIIATAEHLGHVQTPPPTPVQQQSLERIAQSGQQLLELITQVLDMSRIENGRAQAHPEPMAVGPLLAGCCALVEPDAERAGVTLGCSAAAAGMAWADPLLLRKVLLALLSNGIRYNRRGGTVQVSCEEAGNFLRIAVADDGRGIPAGREGEVFQPFVRFVGEESGIPGVGLGLALAKQFTERMHGRIGFESQEGSGSRFWIELPRAERAAA